MTQFNLGKKVFFLYPPVDFSKSILNRLFEDGYEIYKLNSTENIVLLLREFPDSILFINSDYPYEDFDLQQFNDQILHQEDFSDLTTYAFFSQSVTYGDMVKDYVSLEQPAEELYQNIRGILEEAQAHGKREHVRFGSYSEVISTFPFTSEGQRYEVNLHDISPRALSFSSGDDLKNLVGNDLSDMNLKVGAYEITVSGKLDSSREIGGKELYIVTFDPEKYMEYRELLYNFIFTSLERKMDGIIRDLGIS